MSSRPVMSPECVTANEKVSSVLDDLSSLLVRDVGWEH